MIKDLFGILVTVNVNVIRHVMLQNMKTMKIVSVEKSLLIYIIFFSLFFTINIGIDAYFVYYKIHKL